MTQLSPSRPVQTVGAVLRGVGLPLPTVGMTGMWYLDTTNGNLYLRRGELPDPWAASAPYMTVAGGVYPTLRFYGDEVPDPLLGHTGDYYLSTMNVYGQGGIAIIGPKGSGGWP